MKEQLPQDGRQIPGKDIRRDVVPRRGTSLRVKSQDGGR